MADAAEHTLSFHEEQISFTVLPTPLYRRFLGLSWCPSCLWTEMLFPRNHRSDRLLQARNNSFIAFRRNSSPSPTGDAPPPWHGPATTIAHERSLFLTVAKPRIISFAFVLPNNHTVLQNATCRRLLDIIGCAVIEAGACTLTRSLAGACNIDTGHKFLYQLRTAFHARYEQSCGRILSAE